MKNVFTVFEKLGITALVTIGGDDTAFSASHVAKRSGGKIKVAHVPKTIDNDLPLPGSAPTFGYETARHYGVQLVRNLMEDARTTSRWYIIISMGRAAGHLALGIAKASAATLSIISEEFRGRPVTVDEVCDIIIGSIIKRKAEGSQYGLVVLAEGLIEALGEKGLVAALPEGQLERFGKVVRDDHGHLRLGEIEFGRLMKELLTQRLEKLGIKMTFIDKDLGYELRCADPIPFDAEYTRDLGYAAVKFLRSPEAEKYGAIISFVDGKMNPLPFDEMLDPKTGRMQNRRVNVDGEAFECAQAYMIRLEREDFEDAKQLAKLAAVVKMTPEQFKRPLRLPRRPEVKINSSKRRRENFRRRFYFFKPRNTRITRKSEGKEFFVFLSCVSCISWFKHETARGMQTLHLRGHGLFAWPRARTRRATTLRRRQRFDPAPRQKILAGRNPRAWRKKSCPSRAARTSAWSSTTIWKSRATSARNFATSARRIFLTLATHMFPNSELQTPNSELACRTHAPEQAQRALGRRARITSPSGRFMPPAPSRTPNP